MAIRQVWASGVALISGLGECVRAAALSSMVRVTVGSDLHNWTYQHIRTLGRGAFGEV